MPALCAKPERRRHAGIRHRHDDVGGGGRLAGELAAHGLAHVVDRAAVHDRIGPREVDVLEDARPGRLLRREAERLEPVLGDDDDLAVLDVADEAGADDVEGAGLGGEDVAAVELADDERADAEGVAGADELLVGQGDEGVGALDLTDRLDEAVDDRLLARARDEMDDRPRCRSSTGRWRRRG